MSTLFDSPLRRSGIGSFQITRKPPFINDDEEERRRGRIESMDNNNSNDFGQNEALKSCLRVYHETKLSKDNAWSSNLIDTFSLLLGKHHKTLHNFQVVGSTLEASSKVYALRVDSVHNDVLRIASVLSKLKSSAYAGDDGNETRMENNESNVDNALGTNGTDVTEKPKPKRRPRQIGSMITKNESTINAKLETIPCIDPLFAQLNSFVGNIASTDRLMENLLATKQSELQLRSDYIFWDAAEVDLDVNADIDFDACEFVEFSDRPFAEHRLLRTKNPGYIITDTPAEEEDSIHEVSFERPLAASQLAVAFDIDADVEQETADNHFMEARESNCFDDLTEEDQRAINACKGLRMQTAIIADLRPIDASSARLEYSYRPLDNINQFWAGPSHWKFKNVRSSKKLSLANDQNELDANTIVPVQRIIKRKIAGKTSKPFDLGQELKGFCNRDELKIKHVSIKKWDPRKLKLPTDLKLSRNMFASYSFAPGLRVHDSEEGIASDLPEDSYNYNNAADQNYCSNIVDDTDETDTERSIGDNDQLGLTMNGPELAHISMKFTDAPDRVEKVLIPFATKAKVINMKHLKHTVWEILNKNFNTTKDNIEFSVIYNELPQNLSRQMNENLSFSVAFYSVLHLANEKNMGLQQMDTLEDFVVSRLCGELIKA